jgi:Ca-activated chloride channel family protein
MGMLEKHVVSMSIACDRESLGAQGESRVHAVIELRASEEAVERARPPLTAVLAVDVSGSMQGPPIEQVISSVDKLVDLFAETDKVGVVAFSDGATEVCALSSMTNEGRRGLRQRTRRLSANGQTNMEAGLRLAAGLLGARAEHERHVVLLLSDGAPNVGASSKEALSALAASMRPAISLSSLGYGLNHNEDLLLAVSQAGGGPYYFIPDPAMCQLELARALGAAGDIAADGLELSLAPGEGVEILRVLGNPKVRFGAGGLSLALPDLCAGTRRIVVVELAVEPGEAERLMADLLSASLSYRRAGAAPTLCLEQRLSVPFSRTGGAVVPSANADVLVVRCEEVRAEARALADRGQFDGAAALLRALVKEIQAAPGYVIADGSPLSEACELLLDEAMAMERRPSQEQYRAYRKASLGSSMLDDAAMSGAKMGRYSVAVARTTAGAFPIAHLVVLSGPGAGTRHLLKAQCTLGRTSGNDIQIMSDLASRRHASVYALQGEFWVADLGTTNATHVNGKPLGSAPHKLAPGDEIQIGGVKLRYEEG